MRRILRDMRSKYSLKILLREMLIETKENSIKSFNNSEKKILVPLAHIITVEKKEFMRRS
jgi:hypothetical protein